MTALASGRRCGKSIATGEQLRADAPRIIPAGPMGLDDILPMIRNVADLRERGNEALARLPGIGANDEFRQIAESDELFAAAAELEERIRQPITVAGRVFVACSDGPGWQWVTPCDGRSSVSLYAWCNQWQAHVSQHGEFNTAVAISASGFGPTIAAALSDARDRYQAAIDATLLRMSVLLGEVGQ